MDDATKRAYIRIRLAKAQDDLMAAPLAAPDAERIVAGTERFVERLIRWGR